VINFSYLPALFFFVLFCILLLLFLALFRKTGFFCWCFGQGGRNSQLKNSDSRKPLLFCFFKKNDKQTVDRWRREQGDCPRTLRVTATADDGGDDDDDGSN